MEVDFTGTSPQTTGAVNPNIWFTASCTYAAIRTVLSPDILNNAGFFRPIKVVAPEGSFVNPRFPAPLGARGQAGYRVRSAVLGALAQLLPDRMPACPGGSEFAVAFSGYNADRSPFLLLEFHNMSGLGGGPDGDGQDAGPYWLSNIANVPAEVIEAESPGSSRGLCFPARHRRRRAPPGRPGHRAPVPAAGRQRNGTASLRPPTPPPVGTGRRRPRRGRPVFAESDDETRSAAIEVHPHDDQGRRVARRIARFGRLRRSPCPRCRGGVRGRAARQGDGGSRTRGLRRRHRSPHHAARPNRLRRPARRTSHEKSYGIGASFVMLLERRSTI